MFKKDWFWNSADLRLTKKRPLKSVTCLHYMLYALFSHVFILPKGKKSANNVTFRKTRDCQIENLLLLPLSFYVGILCRLSQWNSRASKQLRDVWCIKIQLSLGKDWQWFDGGVCVTWNHFMLFYGWRLNLNFKSTPIVNGLWHGRSLDWQNEVSKKTEKNKCWALQSQKR